jgi:hypothetical protein
MFSGNNNTMGANHETPMFQCLDNKINTPLDASKMNFSGWNNDQQQKSNSLHMYKNSNP